ncbi:MAG: DNA-processing protein DprA [Phycisphaerae bacterium]|nr:DNA-processing protein DprA [Phycisphaerae bacterium]
MGDSHVRAVLRLHLADGVGAVTYLRLVKAFGSAEAVLAAGPAEWLRVPHIGEKIVAAISAITDKDVDDELAVAERAGARVLTQESVEYPLSLKHIDDPPAVLYVRGSLRESDAVSLGVVGSRRCTHYGLEQAQRFGELLGQAGLTLISGGARGIDTAAHRGALQAGGRTVAVMGCGLCTHFPPENGEFFESIVRDGRGALLSELPMRTAVLAGNFPTRNRIISGLSLGVLIVEAARRSGSLITAREAAEQGKTVFAIPGRVDSPTSQGANDLIRNGAILTQGLDDVLEHLGPVGQSLTDAKAAEPTLPFAPANMDATEQRIWDALAAAPRTLDELVRATNLETARATAAMTMLVIKGAVKQQPGNLFARKTSK